MGRLRRHDEPDGTRYQMREKLFAIGDDFWVETEREIQSVLGPALVGIRARRNTRGRQTLTAYPGRRASAVAAVIGT